MQNSLVVLPERLATQVEQCGMLPHDSCAAACAASASTIVKSGAKSDGLPAPGLGRRRCLSIRAWLCCGSWSPAFARGRQLEQRHARPARAARAEAPMKMHTSNLVVQPVFSILSCKPRGPASSQLNVDVTSRASIAVCKYIWHWNLLLCSYDLSGPCCAAASARAVARRCEVSVEHPPPP